MPTKKPEHDPQDAAFDLLTPHGVLNRDGLWTADERTAPQEEPTLEDLALWPRTVIDPLHILQDEEGPS